MFDVYEDEGVQTLAIVCRVNVGKPHACVAYADYEVRGSCKHEHCGTGDWTPVCASHYLLLEELVCSVCLESAEAHVCKIKWERGNLT